MTNALSMSLDNVDLCSGGRRRGRRKRASHSATQERDGMLQALVFGHRVE
jgi:hypothetical protein